MIELLDKIITQIKMNDTSTVISFIGETGESFTYEADADCCSETWFSEIIGMQNLLGHKIEEVKEKDEQYNLEGTRQEVDTLYGFTLKTAQGLCDINFRNSSNGYYGGSCYYTETTTATREIKEDFS